MDIVWITALGLLWLVMVALIAGLWWLGQPQGEPL